MLERQNNSTSHVTCNARARTQPAGVASLRGTLPWIAPEIIKTPSHVTEACDVWSFGVVRARGRANAQAAALLSAELHACHARRSRQLNVLLALSLACMANKLLRLPACCVCCMLRLLLLNAGAVGAVGAARAV